MIGEVAAGQHGVVTRGQALRAGLTRAQIEALIASGRWQRIFTGIYATFSGPVPRESQLWAVALRAGDGAVLSHETAAELAGLLDRPAATVHVTVPHRRTPGRIPGVMLHRSDRATARRHPTKTPPQTRVEETVIDLTQTARYLDDAIGWMARAVGARLTTADRLVTAMRGRQRLRWRRPLQHALADVGAGNQSWLELRYVRTVERAHGLPRAERQAAAAGRRYDDVRYRTYRVRVELDGRAAHPDHERWRDMRRDNVAATEGDTVLRYGTADIVRQPCAVTIQVVEVLRRGGWRGTPRRCARHDCQIA